jgi:urease accessory protein
MTPRPVALGVVGAAAGIDDRAVATIALYDDAAAVASVALELLNVAAAEAANWLAELAPQIETVALAVVADERRVFEQPPPAAVGIRLAAAIPPAGAQRLRVRAARGVKSRDVV